MALTVGYITGLLLVFRGVTLVQRRRDYINITRYRAIFRERMHGCEMSRRRQGSRVM